MAMAAASSGAASASVITRGFTFMPVVSSSQVAELAGRP
jgi:hypothetical protein